jgi:uncharacterized membrane protein
MNILLAGEQWTAVKTEIKGFDHFGSHSSQEGARWIKQALKNDTHEVSHLRSFEVPECFPETMDELRRFDVVILSDIGSNSLLFHPEMLNQGIRHPDRLKLIRDYVREGGGLLMIGGWMSFQGIDGRARYAGTPVEDVLPVTCLQVDDRSEHPDGITPEVAAPEHPVLKGITGPWPFFLGFNKTCLKTIAQAVVSIGGSPLVAAAEFGKGRSAVFTSDCAPHWGPPEFLKWPHYDRLWTGLVRWLARQ